MRPIRNILAASLLIVSTVAPAAAAEWHHPLYLPGGGYWRQRVRLVVHNGQEVELLGRPLAVPIGTKPQEAELVGAEAGVVRVVKEAGQEVLFDIVSPAGEAISDGPIAAGSSLVIPADCPARDTAVYYVYFNNPTAGRVPDFLAARPGVINGDVERGTGPTPAGWRHDPGDDRHRASWRGENPQSGGRCLKTWVADGAEPTWISTRQRAISIIGGARYEMRGWVRAEGVKGNAGWYIHVGSDEKPMMISPMLAAGQGTFDWREVTARFKAPADAHRADLGTVLRGSGTAWFDNVTLRCLDPDKLRAVAERPETITLRELGADAPWQGGKRGLVEVLNFTARDAGQPLVGVDISMLATRLLNQPGRDLVRVFDGAEPVVHFRLGNRLLLEGSSPPLSRHTYFVYASDKPDAKPAAQPDDAQSDYARLVANSRNLFVNPSFEQGDKLPENWIIAGDSQPPVTLGLDATSPAGLGQKCARLSVPSGAKPSWRGWQQAVAAKPGRTYFLAGWVKCRDVAGEVRLHVHLHDSEGQLCSDNPMRSASPGLVGTTDWTLLSGMFTMPADAASLTVHLTSNTSGTVWHDGLLLAEVLPGTLTRLEGRPTDRPDGLEVWPVNAIVKVFPDDVPPNTVPPASISLAGNEAEPLQLAVRGGRDLRDVRVEVDPPVGPGGAKLDDVQIGLVGYVHIDHATSYFRSDTPAWYRKIPTASGMCDGWPGPWPDPLLPRNDFDLTANTTQPVWITVSSGKGKPPGQYNGRVRLVHGGKTLASVPFGVRLWDFTLPDENHVAAIYDVRLGPAGSRYWGKSLDEAYPEMIRFMAERRLCPDTIRPAPVIKYENGKAVGDFGEFDKAAELYFNQLKLPRAYTPWYFYLFGWGHPPGKKFGQLPYPGEPPFEGADRSRLRPEFKRAYQACLKLYWDHLKQKGWQKKVVLYISDEPFDRQKHIRVQMKALCEMIHAVDPEIPIYSSTWKHVPDWDGYLDVWGIGHDGRVPTQQMARLRATGDRIWFTTDGQMCTDTPYCAVERLLPHYCFKYGAEAYEFWGVGWLTYDPYRFGWHAYIHQSMEPGKSTWVRYPNGDGFIMYPGKPIGHAGPVSSIRMEQAREGVEDYEYLYLLRHRVAAAKSAGRDTTSAEAALKKAATLITIPNAGGRYSSKILPDPDALFEVKQALGTAIEELR